MKTIIASLAMLGVMGSAYAAGLPRYDVETQCTEMSEMGGGDGSATIKNGCITMEQRNYDALKSSWEQIPDGIKAQCLELAETGGGSYTTLRGCIRMEEKSASQPKEFKF